MLRRSILSLVLGADIISPPGRLHEEDEAMLGKRNILKPSLPLVCVPGMLLQRCLYLLDGRQVFLLKHLISDGTREHVAGDVPGRRRWYGKRQKHKKREQGHRRHLCHIG